MARRPNTPRRRASRLTPRRWLPLLALVGVSVLAAVALPDPIRPTTAQDRADRAAALVPSAGVDDAISSAWFCGGGSALGSKGPAELVLVIANVGSRPAKATVTVVGDEAERKVRTYALAAREVRRVPASKIISTTWAAATVEVLGGQPVVSREVSGPTGIDAAPCASSAAATWHVASGSTERGASEVLSIYNPFPDSATVDIRFATDSGPRQPRALQGLSVPGGTLRVVPVNETITNRSQIAVTVRTRFGRVVVDRIQRYDGRGEPLAGSTEEGAGPIGLVSTPGVPGTAARWLFPGTSALDALGGRIAVYNPSDQPAEVDVVLTYEEPGRNPSVEPIQLTVPPGQQQITDLAQAGGLEPEIAFTVDVRSLQGVGVVVELLDTAASPLPVTGAAVATGAPVAATRWLAPVSAADDAATSVIVANPSRRPARLTVTETIDGSVRRRKAASIAIPAGDRRTIDLSDVAPGSVLTVDATQPVVVTTGFDAALGLGRSTALAQPAPDRIEALPPA